MSMLSQNVPTSKVRREESDVDARGKRRKMEEEEKQRESDQLEMKKLENLLFGSLYSPVTFGDEEAEDGSALFHVDRSSVRHTPGYDDDEEERAQSMGVRKGRNCLGG